MIGSILCIFLAGFLTVREAATFNASECGTQKNCAMYPHDCIAKGGKIEQCAFVFSSGKGQNEAIEMELLGKINNEFPSQYVAFGFSNDNSMGDEPVIACISTPSNQQKSMLSRNNGKSNEPFGGNSELHINLVESYRKDGFLYCKVQQNFEGNLDGTFRPDPNKQYFMLAASGSVDSNQLNYHEVREVLTRKVRLADAPPKPASRQADGPAVVSAPAEPTSGPFGLTGATKSFLVRIHGLLMTIAWLSCISLGIFSARYLRETFGSKVNGIKVWFHLHRALNVIGVILTVLAAASVAVALDLKWAGPWVGQNSEQNLNAGAIHSFAGALAVLLAIIQPFNSLLRCGPDHSKRPIFNVFHRSLGLIGLLAAVVALFLALYNFRRHFPNWPLAFSVFVGSIVAAIVLALIAEILGLRARNSSKNQVTSFELTAPAGGKHRSASSDAFSYQQNSGESFGQSLTNKILFTLFAVILVGCTVVLIYIIQ